MEKARKTSYETEIDYSMQALEAKDELQMEVQLYKKNGEQASKQKADQLKTNEKSQVTSKR